MSYVCSLTLLMGMAGKGFGWGEFAVTYPWSPVLYTALSCGPGELAAAGKAARLPV